MTQPLSLLPTARPWWPSIRATADERRRNLPGDERIPEPLDTITHAITIHRPPRDVWPWLVQMGAGKRAGWYSHDWIDNGRQPSAVEIIPELQQPQVGAIFNALPAIEDGFRLSAIDQERSLTLDWPAPDGRPTVTWTFVLEPIGETQTRLLVRVRGAQDYRFLSLPVFLTKPLIHFVHFVMERKQMLGIVDRVESH